MKKLQSIENALLEINDVVFQELCDSFLSLRNKNYIAFSRTGSQAGKQKSTKGTPDSFKLLPNGKYIFIEYTTVGSSKKNKLLKDIEKCLDEDITKVSIQDIAEIIICTNFNLNATEIKELEEKVENNNVELDIYTLDRLAIELFHQHPNLCSQYLGIPLDTGQILSIDKFINEYNKTANRISTPLDNVFMHRETELIKLKEAINEYDLLIITGYPGIGKTKLALEGIKSFLSENHNYNAYCVSTKYVPILNDLYQHLDMNKDYILFVDDANRIDSFNQIIGFYKNSRSGKLKILITVRDYALDEISSRCVEFKFYELQLRKLTDEQIIDIIKSESFKIFNPDYHKEIVRIADGNPRLAIMASKLAIQKQNLNVLSDVSELFEQYFIRFVIDNVDLTKLENLKTLGLIAFFRSLPYKDKSSCIPILDKFLLDYNDFIESIDLLNKSELVELQFEYVKISEQNLATYFFYKTFIKDNILSFNILLEDYYNSDIERFRDSIIPANNTFGYHNVIEKVKPVLLKYWTNIKTDEEKAFNLILTFWFYLIEESIEYMYNKIYILPEPKDSVYITTYDTNQFSYKRDRNLEFLGNFFNQINKLKDALELAFEYSRKLPETLPELIFTIREHLLFDSEDQRMNYERQKILINLLIEKSSNSESIYETAFPALAISFLQYNYRHVKGGRNNTIIWYHFPFPMKNETKILREKLWNKINKDFKKKNELYFKLLVEYSQRTPEVVKEVMEFDLQYVQQIIKNHLSPSEFEHCYYVQEQIRWFIKNELQNNEFDILRSNYTNERYSIYLNIDWDRIRDKESYEFEDYAEYEKLKEAEVRENFVFNSLDSFKNFYEHYLYLVTWEKNTYSLKNSLDYIIDENFKKNFDLGVSILEHILIKNNEIQYLPYLPFQKFLNNNWNSQIIWDTISNKNYNQSFVWQLQYFFFLDTTLINISHCANLLNTVHNINENSSIHFIDLMKYLKYDDKLVVKILRIIVDKRKNQNISIRMTHNFFNKYYDYLKNDITTVKEAYIQQAEFDPHYDYGGTELLSILKIDRNFITEYIEYLYLQKERHQVYEYKNLSVVWRLDGAEDVFTHLFNFIADNENSMVTLEHFCNSFFYEISTDEIKIKTDQFILNYIKINYNNIKRMNMIADVLRHTKVELFEEACLYFLKLTQDIDIYKKISWIGSGESATGNESIGEKMALKWRRILEITNKLDLGLKLIPIKKYINDEIEDAMKYAEHEKKRRFSDGY
jgi:hypothetical protein